MPKTDFDLASLLLKLFGQDALILSDPADHEKKREPFYGLLLRSDGTAYRVPLIDIEPAGIDIPSDTGLWESWPLHNL